MTVVLAAALFAPSAAGQDAPTQTAPAEAKAPSEVRRPLRHVRVREGGASVRNVADVQGVPIGEIPGNGLLAVYRERAGWLEVDAPGGFAVWVYGRFLEPTPEPAVLAVTRNAVNMRPSPSTEIHDYPLGQQLQAGDRVTLIELADPEAELAKTWARIWSPAGACGWVQAARTEPLPDGVDGAALWRQAEAALAEKAREGGAPAARPVENTPRPGAGESALLVARALLDAERANPFADFGAVRAAFEQVLALEPSDDLRAQAQHGIEVVDALEAKSRTEAELAAEQQRRQQELAERQERSWREAAARDPDDTRFDARGRVERVTGPTGAVEYRVVRDGRAVAVLACSSGRYDLALFTGYDVGIAGAPERPETSTAADVLPRVDAVRLEVLARRG